MSVTDRIRSACLGAQSVLGQYPRVYLPVARRRSGVDFDGLPHVVGSGSEAVLEGYPRSGNTFAVAAFRLAQRRPVQLAHHVHAPAQILEGLRLGLPVVLLIRWPEEAILSVVIRTRIGMEQALRMYVRFYTRVLPQRNEVVVAPFPTVVTAFGSIIRDMNDRFGTHFREFVHTEENVRRVFDSVEARGRRDATRRGRGHEIGVARPSARRETLKAALRERYARKIKADLRLEAEALYKAFVEGVDGASRT
jgi:hypothetical protein